MHSTEETHGLSRIESYELIISQLEGLLVSNWVANLANASALLWQHFHNLPEPHKSVNWAGFYTRARNDDLLVLGPFQGKVACQEIKVGAGVCGTAASEKRTQIVRDVHEFPGHIACDGDTNSEIVVPILNNGDVVGVLDIDCLALNGFDKVDGEYLEKFASLLAPSL